MNKNLIILLLLSFVFTQCIEEVKPTKLDIGRDYYPVAIGNYWIYDVSETKVLNNEYDSVHYQVRELVDTVFTDQTGQMNYRVIKSRRQDEEQSWRNDSIIVVSKQPNYVLRTQNNLKVVSLVFPVTEGKEWNAHGFNFQGTNNNIQEFRYAQVSSPFVLNGQTYDTTATVIQGEPNALILDNRYEVYSYGIGLLYKHFQYYQYQNVNGVTDPNYIVNGTQRIYKLKEFNTEE